MNTSLPTRALPEHPNLDQLRRQAKEVLEQFLSGDSAAMAEVNKHYHGADPATFALHDAQPWLRINTGLTVAEAKGIR